MPGKKYTKEDILRALTEIRKGGGLRKVAIKYGIPHSTLQDYKHQRYAHNPHPNKALTPEEEEVLVNYILWMREHGFPVTRAIVKALALTMIKASQRTTLVNLDKGPSAMWWSRFQARHPEISAPVPVLPNRVQVHEATLQAITGLFAVCETLYQKHNLEEKLHLIFSCNDTGFWEKPQNREVVSPKKRKEHMYAQQTASMELITVHCCVSAAGQSIPPFVIYPRCLPSTSYVQDGPRNALYGVSAKGYMDGELFMEWLSHFVKYAPEERPLLLYLDQHETYVSMEVVDFCRENSIEVVWLPEHTTHVLQPLDVAVFGPLKAAFNTMAQSMGLVDEDMVVGKRRFATVLNHAYQQAVTPENIREGFRRTGLFPLCKDAVDLSKMLKLVPFSCGHAQGTSATTSAANPSSSTTAYTTCPYLPSSLVQSGIFLDSLTDILVPHRKKSSKKISPSHTVVTPRKNSRKTAKTARVLSSNV